MIPVILIVCSIGYALGCLQWSYILIRFLKKEDIREAGFGNAGASNTFISYGKTLGFTVAMLDGLKALFSIRIIYFLIHRHLLPDASYLIFLNALFVILGHNYPFFMGFKGGKGTASLIGILFGLGTAYGLLGIFIILAFAFLTNYIALGTVALLIYFLLLTAFKNYGNSSLLIAAFISLMSIYLHIPNFKRISAGTESKVRAVFSKK